MQECPPNRRRETISRAPLRRSGARVGGHRCRVGSPLWVGKAGLAEPGECSGNPCVSIHRLLWAERSFWQSGKKDSMMQTSRYSPGFPQTVHATLRRGYEVRRTDLAAALPFRDEALLSPSGSKPRFARQNRSPKTRIRKPDVCLIESDGASVHAKNDHNHPSQRKRSMRS